MNVSLSRRSLLAGSPAVFAMAGVGALPNAVGAAAAGASRVRLAGNENPHGPGPAARAAIAAAISDCWMYPIFEEMALKAAIARSEGLTPAHVLIGSGSSELLHLAAVVYGLDRGELVTAVPTFSLVADHARAVGATVREVPLDTDMRHDLGAMAAAVSARTRLIYVCNPNNPTGTMVSGEALNEFIAAVAGRAAVLVDEAYLDFLPDAAAHSAVARVKAGDDVIVVRTFSKLHGLAGLRIGYALARPDVVTRLARLRLTAPGSLGVAAAAASLGDTAFQDLSRRSIAEARIITTAALDDLGLRYAQSGANFLFFDTGQPVAEFLGAMRERGFSLGRPFAPYRSWCRVTMGTVAQMQAFDRALRSHYASAAR
jgi:histidinol-phosphate aminotransferase